MKDKWFWDEFAEKNLRFYYLPLNITTELFLSNAIFWLANTYPLIFNFKKRSKIAAFHSRKGYRRIINVTFCSLDSYSIHVNILNCKGWDHCQLAQFLSFKIGLWYLSQNYIIPKAMMMGNWFFLCVKYVNFICKALFFPIPGYE